MTTSTAKRPRTKAAAPAWPITLELFDDDIDAVRAVALAASKDEALDVLTAIWFASDGKTLTLTATDSYRIHVAEIPTAAPKFEALVPAAWLVKTLREVKPALWVSVIELTETHATISNASERRSAKLVTDDYPDVHGLFAKYDKDRHDPDKRAAVNPEFFADVLKACRMFGGDTAPVRFRVPDHQWHPLRFDVEVGKRKFSGLLMPLRVAGG